MKYIWIVTFCFITSSIWAANKIKVRVDAGQFIRKDCVVSVNVSSLGIDPTVGTLLFEEKDGVKKGVDCQIIWEKTDLPVLYWILEGETPAGTSRKFIIERADKREEAGCMQVEDSGKELILKKGSEKVLQYNYSICNPPAGVNPAYQRSGFIHPAYSPSGNILTAIQPKDHYHHYGIWNPWTRIEYDGKMYDLWNLKDKKGTVRARDVETIYQGSICAGYKANLDHYIFTQAGEQVIMNESWNIKTWNATAGFLWDFESVLSPSTSLPVLIKAYRYAGFGFRATEEWTKDNCEMFTSEGKTRQQIDGTTARWIYVTGICGDRRSGLLFLGHPDNYNSPEPLRIWDEGANNGCGDAFVNFAPTKNKDWQLEPDKRYMLRYRIFSFDGEMTKEDADRLWNDFATPPQVIVLN